MHRDKGKKDFSKMYRNDVWPYSVCFLSDFSEKKNSSCVFGEQKLFKTFFHLLLVYSRARNDVEKMISKHHFTTEEAHWNFLVHPQIIFCNAVFALLEKF